MNDQGSWARCVPSGRPDKDKIPRARRHHPCCTRPPREPSGRHLRGRTPSLVIHADCPVAATPEASTFVRVDALVQRIVDSLPTATGKVLIRDRAGDRAVVELVAHECVNRGLVPIVEHVSNAELRRQIDTSPPEVLSRWDVDRLTVTEEISGLIVLAGWRLDLAGLAPASVAAWSDAAGRVEAIIDDRRVSTVVVAVPTENVAANLAISVDVLSTRIMASIVLSATQINAAAFWVATRTTVSFRSLPRADPCVVAGGTIVPIRWCCTRSRGRVLHRRQRDDRDGPGHWIERCESTRSR